jgi:DNA-binding IscR family transcriptional regulator
MNISVKSEYALKAVFDLSAQYQSVPRGVPMPPVESMKSSGRGLKEDPFCGIWQRVDEAVSDVLDHTSFGELAREWQAKSAHYVPNWEI